MASSRKSPAYKLSLIHNPPPETRRRIVICVPDDEEWLAFFWGYLYKLGWWISYERDELHTAKTVARTWFELVEQARKAYLRLEPSPCDVPFGDCVDYPASAVFIQYEPVNPFLDPETIPAGYNAPPFTIVKETDILLLALGYMVGDVITDITRIPAWVNPFPQPESGYTRFRISVTRKSEIELHFVSMLAGGIALVTKNSDIATAQIVDLGFNLVEGQPSTVDEIIEEVFIDDENGGYVDVTFLPLPDPVTLVRYGGGFRSVTICQEGIDETMTFDVWQGENDPCKLYKQVDDNPPEVFANLQLCKPKIRVNTGGGIVVSTDDGETWEPIETEPINPRNPELPDDDNRCLAAANAAKVIQLAYEEVRVKYATTTDVLTLAVAAFVVLGFIFVFPPSIIVVAEIIGLMIAVGGFMNAQLTEDDYDEIKCILYCNSTIDNTVVTFDYDTVLSEMQNHEWLPVKIAGIMLPLLGEDGLNRAGTVTAITQADCADCCPSTTCNDFTLDMVTGEAYTIIYGYQADSEVTNGWLGSVYILNIELATNPDCVIESVSFAMRQDRNTSTLVSKYIAFYDANNTLLWTTGADENEPNGVDYTLTWQVNTGSIAKIAMSYAWNGQYFGGGTARVKAVTVNYAQQ